MGGYIKYSNMIDGKKKVKEKESKIRGKKEFWGEEYWRRKNIKGEEGNYY